MPREINALRHALKFVLKWEGDYSNDPDDPGGETKWGISKRAHPELDIKNLTEEQALDIYVKEYWEPMGCDQLPFPYNVAVFDTAVNCGQKRASNWLRMADSPMDFIGYRRQYYYDLINRNQHFAKYLKGWLNRVYDLEKFVEQHKGNTPTTQPA